MTDQVVNKAHVVSDDVMVSILAAMARIECVPSSVTLIDSISDKEWHSEEVAEWKIVAGSTNIDEADAAGEFEAHIPADA